MALGKEKGNEQIASGFKKSDVRIALISIINKPGLKHFGAKVLNEAPVPKK